MTIMTPHVQRRECAICFSSQYSDNPDSPQRFYSTPCNHHFHFECLERWCHNNNSCPTCRFDTVMNLPNNNEINGESYSIYLNNYNARNNNEPSTFPENEEPSTSQNNDAQNDNDNNNFSIVNIDHILDNIHDDYNNTDVIHSNNITALLNLSNTNQTYPLWSNNNNYNYINNNENYLVRDRYYNIINRYNQRINQNNIRNNHHILENNDRRNNVRLNIRRNSVINLDDLDAQIT